MVQTNNYLKIWFPLLFCIIGVCFFNLSVTGFNLQFVPGDIGDSRFINYILEHGYQYLCGKNAFWDAPFMYPQKNVLAFSDNMIGTLPVYSSFRLFGADRETAYQLWWITISILNFICCYIVLLRMTKNPIGATLGAFIFAFGLFNQSQMSYLQMNIRFAIPFIFFYAWKLVTDSSIKNLILYLTWMLIQFYAVIYTGILALYLSFIFIAVVALVNRSWSFVKFYLKRNHFVYTLLSGFIFGGLMYFLMRPYIAISGITGLRTFWSVVPTVPLFNSWFFSHESSYPWKFLSGMVNDHFPEWYLHNIFPGLLPMLSFVIVATWILNKRRKKQPVPKLALSLFIITLIIFVLFTRLPNGYTLYALIFKLPGMNSLRVLSRIMHIQLFFLVALFATLVTALFEWKNKKLVNVLSVLLGLLVIGDNAFDANKSLRTPKADLQQRISSRKTDVQLLMKPNHHFFAMVNQKDEPDAYVTHLDAMLIAQEMHMPCINAYTSYCPDDYGPFFLNPNTETLKQRINKRSIDENEVLIYEQKR